MTWNNNNVKKWEYKRRTVKDELVDDTLRTEGLDGWELTSAVFARVYDNADESVWQSAKGLRLIFKREIV